MAGELSRRVRLRLADRGTASKAWRIIAVKFTGTQKLERGPGKWDVRRGKRYLVSRMQVLLQTKRVELAETAESRDLVDDLLNYELSVTDNANVTAGDLATALGLAILMDRKTDPTYDWSN